jgi:general secretion pathway protein G
MLDVVDSIGRLIVPRVNHIWVADMSKSSIIILIAAIIFAAGAVVILAAVFLFWTVRSTPQEVEVTLPQLIGESIARPADAKLSAANAQLSAFETQVQIFELDTVELPMKLEDLRQAPDWLPDSSKWMGPYAKRDIPLDPWGQPYRYERVEDTGYRIWSAGPDSESGTADDLRVAIDPGR